MSRPEGPGALHEKPRTLGRETGEAPVCFRDVMGYHGISRAVKEWTGVRVAPGDTDATLIQQRLGLRNSSDCDCAAVAATSRRATTGRNTSEL